MEKGSKLEDSENGDNVGKFIKMRKMSNLFLNKNRDLKDSKIENNEESFLKNKNNNLINSNIDKNISKHHSTQKRLLPI